MVRHARRDYEKSEKLSGKGQTQISLEDVPEPAYEQDFSIVTKSEFDFEEQRLAESFAVLPLLRRQVLTMMFAEDLSTVEIARRLNCSTDYVYKLKQRALKKLKDLMIGGNEDD